nr:ATP-dependent DNA helicase RecG [Chitinophagales bacterium]
QSYCILITGKKLSNDSKQRIAVMVQTNDGFVIAEEDLRLRGPGDIQGTQQSGVVNLRLADLAADVKILEAARNTAKVLIEQDPGLEKPEHRALLRHMQVETKEKVWGKIS